MRKIIKKCYPPLGPGRPGSPSSPKGPGIPGGPRGPFVPGLPGSPGRPFIPAGPGGPISPRCPFQPGAPETKHRDHNVGWLESGFTHRQKKNSHVGLNCMSMAKETKVKQCLSAKIKLATLHHSTIMFFSDCYKKKGRKISNIYYLKKESPVRSMSEYYKKFCMGNG